MEKDFGIFVKKLLLMNNQMIFRNNIYLYLSKNYSLIKKKVYYILHNSIFT